MCSESHLVHKDEIQALSFTDLSVTFCVGCCKHSLIFLFLPKDGNLYVQLEQFCSLLHLFFFSLIFWLSYIHCLSFLQQLAEEKEDGLVNEAARYVFFFVCFFNK